MLDRDITCSSAVIIQVRNLWDPSPKHPLTAEFPQLPFPACQLQKLFTSVAFTCLGQPPGIDEMDLRTVLWNKPAPSKAKSVV